MNEWLSLTAFFSDAVFKTNGRPVAPGDQKIGLDQLNLTLGK